MKLKIFFKRHGSFLNLMLLFLGGVVGYYLVSILPDLGNGSYVIPVIEKNAIVERQQHPGWHLMDREVHSSLQIKVNGFLDFLMLSKRSECNIFQLLLAALALFQIFKINAIWSEKRFSKKLYVMIDILGIIGTVMWIFSRLQDWRQEKILNAVAGEQLQLANVQVFMYLGIGLILITGILKSFAQTGNRLQEEQDLTI